MEKSLDPRVNRLPDQSFGDNVADATVNQLETYEVFVQPKEGRPLEHEGVVHASDEDMAFIFAKEQFSRRSTCVGILIVRTDHVHVSPMSDGGVNVYDKPFMKQSSTWILETRPSPS
jgi:ring-1,2-phenylacetyl-CoA epoxidase subunit PaaB